MLHLYYSLKINQLGWEYHDPLFQIKKPRHREVKQLAQSHTAEPGFKPRMPAPETVLPSL